MATAVRADTPQETLSGNLCWLLSRAAQSLSSQFSDGLEELGMSPRAQCVLSTAMSGDFTQTALAQAVGLDKTTMVVTIDELEAAGLAERRPAEGDRRARIVGVTDVGRRKVAQAEEIVARVQTEALAALPAGERELLVDALARLVGERLAAPTPCGGTVRRR
jgi:MarR family transcriptional regulator, transcriptional regulator for hemolysin